MSGRDWDMVRRRRGGSKTEGLPVLGSNEPVKKTGRKKRPRVGKKTQPWDTQRFSRTEGP